MKKWRFLQAVFFTLLLTGPISLSLSAQEAAPADGPAGENAETADEADIFADPTEDAAAEEEAEPADDIFADPFADPFADTGEETPQADDSEGDDDLFADPFADPFAVSESDEESGRESGEEESEETEIASGPDDDWESMFGDDMVEELDTEEQNEAPHEEFLKEEGVTWGGSFNGSTEANWSWNNVGTEEFLIAEPVDEVLTPDVKADLFFDARPDTDFRIFGKFKIEVSNTAQTGITGLESLGINTTSIDDSSLPEGWYQEENDDGDTVIYNDSGVPLVTIPAEDTADEGEEEEEEPQTGDAVGLELNVFELFSDFSWKDRLFFRFGKHTIQWGTGYFWSPADVLNLTSIDPEDPTAEELEGPISLKTQFPFGVHNAYLYVITNFGAKPFEVAFAPKVEFVAGTAEIGLAGYYQRALSPRLISTVAWSLSDFDFFGEGVVSFGSDKVFIRESRDQSAAEEDPDDNFETVLDTWEVTGMPFFSFTLGTRYLKTFTNDRGSIALIGQYWFNGEGYKNSDLLKAGYYLALNNNTNGLYIADEEDQPPGYTDPPDLNLTDLQNFGRHYAAATVSWQIFDTDLSLSVIGLANLSDLSGVVIPALSYSFFDYFSVTANARFTFGEAGDEYSNPEALFPGSDVTGTTFAFSLVFSMGSGIF